MSEIRAGDGSNAPVSAVTDILSQHFAEEETVETPQEDSVETPEASEQEDFALEAEQMPDENQEEATDDAQAPGDTEVKTFTELAEALEMDPSALYNLTYAMPDDMDPVTLSEMKDVYVQHKRGTLDDSEGRAALEQEQQQFAQYQANMQQQMQMQQQVPEQVRYVDSALQNIQATFDNTNWDELEKVDPGDAALQRQKLTEASNNLMYQRNQMQGAMQQEHHNQQVAFAQQQAQDIYKVHPEWEKNPEQVAQAWEDVKSYAKDFGISDQEMAMIPNGKIFNMLHAAASQHTQASGSKSNIKKLTRKSAPALRASAVRRAGQGKRSQLDKLVQRGTDSSDIRDQTAAVNALLNS